MNSPPVITNTQPSYIEVPDGATNSTLIYYYDPEGSPLTQLRIIPSPFNPPWISITGANTLVASPNSGEYRLFSVYVEAFDGAMVSSPWPVTINVTDFPFFDDQLRN